MRILLVADVHNKPHGSRATLKKIKNAVNSLGCDLTVFLGDMVHGPAVERNYEKYLREVADTACGKAFATVFGNHDDECCFTKKDILDVLKKYPNCKTAGCDYVVEMQGETLAFIDSGSYYNGKESFYDIVKSEQIEFIKNNIYGRKAVLFQHIIVPDIMEYIDELDVPVKGAVLDSGKYYRFKPDVKYTGALGEKPCPPDVDTGEFEALMPHLKAMCFGHDHKNSFEFTANGVRFIQCPGSGNNSYDKFCRSKLKILDTETLQTETVLL